MYASVLAPFGAVARCWGITRAAKELHSVQSNVTNRIKALEDVVGVPVFVRHRRCVARTMSVTRLLPFAARGLRNLVERRSRVPLLTHSGGRTIPLIAGATVLETLRANGIPHASVCGGRARCTTCRVLVTKGLDGLPQPAALEAKALRRIAATPGMRLACQIRPRAAPRNAANASASAIAMTFKGSFRLPDGPKGMPRIPACPAP